jgi:hypothetical protein
MNQGTPLDNYLDDLKPLILDKFREHAIRFQLYFLDSDYVHHLAHHIKILFVDASCFPSPS